MILFSGLHILMKLCESKYSIDLYYIPKLYMDDIESKMYAKSTLLFKYINQIFLFYKFPTSPVPKSSHPHVGYQLQD